jgi:membrane-associated phospholipid phosphatase
MYKNIKIYIFLLVVYLVGLPSYYSYLPTIPIYDNNEAYDVEKITIGRTIADVRLFRLTNESVSPAFTDHVKESIDELDILIDNTSYIILAFKWLINRPRPYQINNNIDYYDTHTGKTPSMPAGHAFQAYYLSKVLSKKYPEKKELFEEIAKKCDDCRVYAGIHYPSDGEFSKKIVDLLYFYI